ncbi:MAG: DNA repair protein RecO [Burkholderiaceae bacterium]|nr:DNA repair protein RecO [Burkholderiaceae bacterium]
MATPRAASGALGRVENEAAFLLHSIPYKESSLVVELFTRHHGRIGAVAKGAKRPHSAIRAVLLQFQPLRVRFTGKNELRTLTGAEWQGGMTVPSGRALLSAFYLNELILRLVPREDPHPSLFDGYERALASLSGAGPVDDTLRRFEWLLLRESGYAPELLADVEGEPVGSDAHYLWRASEGFERSSPGASGVVVSGETLHSLASGRFDTAASRQQAKYLTRAVLSHHLDGVPLSTRQILMDLQRR